MFQIVYSFRLRRNYLTSFSVLSESWKLKNIRFRRRRSTLCWFYLATAHGTAYRNINWHAFPSSQWLCSLNIASKSGFTISSNNPAPILWWPWQIRRFYGTSWNWGIWLFKSYQLDKLTQSFLKSFTTVIHLKFYTTMDSLLKISYNYELLKLA